MSTIAQMVLYDLATNRPAASIAGRVFYASDTKAISRDNGSTWDDVTPPSGSSELVLLESHTASTSASLDFTTWQNSAYDIYDIYIENLTWSGSTFLGLRFSTDGGSTYDTANYQWTTMYSIDTGGSDSGGQVGSFSAGSTAEIQVVNSNHSIDANTGVNAKVTLYLPQSALYKQAVSEAAFLEGGTIFQLRETGIYKNTAAVNALRFILGTGNIASGTVRIYGIKNT